MTKIHHNDALVNDWHPVCFDRHLAVGKPCAVRVLDRDIVVWRSERDGVSDIHAWLDRCVHRGTRLSLGKVIDNDRLQCPYHGWIYDTQGQCVHVPAQPDWQPSARACVERFQTRIAYGLVWVCLSDTPNALAPFPEWENRTFRKIPCGPYNVATSGPRIVENFLDVSHFAFVHDNILGTKDHAAIDDYQVALNEEGVVATGVNVYQPDPYGTGQGDTVAYTYRANRPLSAYLHKESAGPNFSILLVVTPHTEESSSAFMWMAMNYGHDIAESQLIEWQDEIFSQDQPILESQQPRRLPLDPKSELSIRGDRTSVNYRRWLKDLGVTFGTL